MKKKYALGGHCPNHACRLYLTDTPGLGECEISGYIFKYEDTPQTIGFAQPLETVLVHKIVNGAITPVRVPVHSPRKLKDIIT